MPSTFGIVDLFAGPGGIGEGFASLVGDGHPPFRIGISVEKEASAHRTLTLRAFLREYRARHGGLPKEFIDFHAGLVSEPDWSAVDAEAWQHAIDEARALELGAGAAATAIDGAIATLKVKYDDTTLIGGPPCQAYSLVGRVRSRGKVGYVPEEDARHYLFREYIRVLDRLRPAAFVMENVKGMLSSTVESRLVIEMLMDDLSSLGTGHAHHYELRAVRVEDGKASLQEAAQPSDFIARAEAFGVPQRRHRVIIVGIRSDLAGRAPYYSLVLELDPAIIAGLVSEMDPAPYKRDQPVRVDPTEPEVADAALRLLRLLDRPDTLEVLGPQLSRELHYWLLIGRHDPAVRGLGVTDSHAHRIARAVSILRHRYAEPIRIEALADAAGMSLSAFHVHFRSITSLSPLQFQKQLRLIEARRRMLAQGEGVADAAYAVGYESVPQFTFEYGRMFGQPPGRDIRQAQTQLKEAV